MPPCESLATGFPECLHVSAAQEFLDEHPGGPDVVTALAGKDRRITRLMLVHGEDRGIIEIIEFYH